MQAFAPDTGKLLILADSLGSLGFAQGLIVRQSPDPARQRSIVDPRNLSSTQV
jgi:hypothetical protein